MAPSHSSRHHSVNKQNAAVFFLVLLVALCGLVQQRPVLNQFKAHVSQNNQIISNTSNQNGLALQASPNRGEEETQLQGSILIAKNITTENEGFQSSTQLSKDKSQEVESANISKSNGNRQQKRLRCAPRQGVIVSNLMGRLANNLFEIGFANRMSEELCWPVWYRTQWQGELSIHNHRGQFCFPNAGVGLPQPVSSDLQAILPHMTVDYWNQTLSLSNAGNTVYSGWVENLTQAGLAHSIGIAKYKRLFQKHQSLAFVRQLRSETSTVQMLNLGSFFIDSRWIVGWEQRLRHVLHIHEACCKAQPPPEAVVVHIRDFGSYNDKHLDAEIQTSVYLQIMDHYNLRDRPIWIVCQPDTVHGETVKEFIAAFPDRNITVYSGVDPYDAFCTLTRAKTLLLTAHSSFSQMAAILAGEDAQVHYPLPTLRRPLVTVNMKKWKYHLVVNKTRVSAFDINRNRIGFVTS